MDKKEPALDVLTETIKSRRNRTFAQVHEEILELYLTLCIDLRRGHLAKEGLYQYKLICQQIALNSFEKAVNFYLNESASRTEEARKQSKDTVQKMMGEIDDLDQLQTPERLGGAPFGESSRFLIFPSAQSPPEFRFWRRHAGSYGSRRFDAVGSISMGGVSQRSRFIDE